MGLFGTDGVRGVANQDPLTPEQVCRLGAAAASWLGERWTGAGRPALLIGRDTRLSGPLLEQALVAGILSTGVDAWPAGVLPTPAVAALVPRLAAAGGVVLSASHNPFEDNGVKLFSARGDKLPDAGEAEIEARLAGPAPARRPIGSAIGRLTPVAAPERRYLETLRAAVPGGLDLRGLRVVVDCAHGAMHRVAPRLLRQLGAEVVSLGVRPTGTNINRGAGALHPAVLQARVRAAGAAVGLAFDGDGDRLITVDETGAVRDGDHLLAICARDLQARGALRAGVVVSTVMANLGLARLLAEAGIGLVRTPVGDRHVLEAMRRLGANLGGEQSGHLVFLDHATTGDGLLAGLMLLRVMRDSGQPLSALAAPLRKCPQVLVNLPVRTKPALETLPGLAELVTGWEQALDGRIRILLRYSGTEPLARVMVEGDDQSTIEKVADQLAAAIRDGIGGEP
jgi:phosphoglucosamine mutase